jgi:CheY-like chemotaxis protein
MIEGSLRNVPLTDVLQIVTTGQKSGLLDLEQEGAHARVHVEHGRIHVAHMEPGSHLGEILVRMDLLANREVQEILERQRRENPGTPLGAIAVQDGLITVEELTSALRLQAVEVLAELLAWTEGTFQFAERPLEASQVPVEGGHDAMQLLMDADALRRDLDAGSADPSTVFERAGDPTRFDLPAGAWDLLGLINGRLPARTVVAEAEMTETDGLRLLRRMAEIGVIRQATRSGSEAVVLVLCRSNALQRLLRLALQRASMRAELFGDPDEAFEALDRVRPHVLLIDDREGEGWSWLRRVRATPGRGHLPALVLEGAEARAAGPFARWRRPRADTLERPFDEWALQERIARLAGRKLV